MKASEEILAMEPPHSVMYQHTREYQWGFSEAVEIAHMITYRQELKARHMQEALESINTGSQAIVEALGRETVFKIRCALKVYREQQAK